MNAADGRSGATANGTSRGKSSGTAPAGAQPLLVVEGLSVSFGHARRWGLGPARGGTTVVDDVSFSVGRGECVAIVGESGSGKSVTARSILGLAGAGSSVAARRLELDGEDLTRASEHELRAIRGAAVGLVSQDALVSLDPLRRVRAEVGDALRLHDEAPRAERAARIVELLTRVGVPRPELRANQYPHELSGGLRQRALIAAGIAASPRLLIADEPTTALDMTVQAGILRLLAALRADDTGLLVISHDLGVVSTLADRVIVMRDGRIVDEGPTDSLLRGGSHPYTRALVRAVPSGVPRGTPLVAEPSSARASAAPPPRVIPVPVLDARGLRKSFGSGPEATHAVRDVDLEVRPGETLGIVGESGSGKTTLGRLLLALTEPDAGTVRLDGAPWSGIGERERRSRRRLAGLVSQDTAGTVDPRWTVERVVADALPARIPARERRDRVRASLAAVSLAPDLLDCSPRTLSGGQRQRVGIARALAAEPRVLVLDEPVSALDATVAAGVLDLLDDLQRRHGIAYVFISHDLAVIRHMSDRVAVMHDGSIVETGPTEVVFADPSHDYTRRLLADAPVLPAH